MSATERPSQPVGPDIDPPRPTPAPWAEKLQKKLPTMVREWVDDPDFSIYFVGFLALGALLFLRIGANKFVFDEQEAILANPFVRGKQPWLDAFKRDFWGLLPDRSIGSYRPIPNLIWRALWRATSWKTGNGSTTTFVWINVVLHAINCGMLASWVRQTLRRPVVGWIAGATLCSLAILTEAVTGIVGIADCLGATSLLFCLFALTLRWELVGPAVFASTLIGLLCKESAIVNVGLVPLAAVLLASAIDPDRPQPWRKASVSVVGGVAAIGIYFVIRHHTYHLDLPIDAALDQKGLIGHWRAQIDHYIGAPNLPVDTFNNPLAVHDAPPALRIAGGLRVYARGFTQLFVPIALSPDYSMPQEPLPQTFFESPMTALGIALMLVPPMIGGWLWWRAFRVLRATTVKESDGYRATREVEGPAVERYSADVAMGAFCLIAWPAAFFPLSNIPKALPTVRAERFWYTPAVAISIGLALLLLWIAKHRWTIAFAIGSLFIVGQAARTRLHANDFSDDLSFWESAARAVPRNAKAHLNYSVMLGARGPELRGMTAQQAQEARLKENIRATELAPRWDMAFIYVGDTLCQLNRLDEAWDWYKKGIRIGSNNSGLIALALQCMSDHNVLLAKERDALEFVAEREFDTTWAQYLVRDTVSRERKCRGVDLPPEPLPTEWADPVPWDEPEEGASASARAGASASASGVGARGTASTGASAGASAGPSASASAGASASASAGASASASAGAGAGAGASASSSSAPAKAPIAKAPLPPCGVDPKYRPRGLDGEPKSE